MEHPEALVHQIVRDTFGVDARSIQHMPFGHSSRVYDVELPERSVIVRLNTAPRVFAGTQRNLEALGKVGLPVPRVLAADLTLRRYPAAFLILTRIPGRDLRYALPEMTRAQMTALARQLVGFQRTVGALPPGTGFGYVPVGEPGPHPSWSAIVARDLTRSLSGLQDAAPPESVGRVHGLMERFRPYLDRVGPTCFLDDVTTKNVIVDQGALRGIVDLDHVCYGDPLFWLGLTQTAVVCDVGDQGMFYVNELFRLWALTREQRRVVDLYSAIHSLDFAACAHRSGDAVGRERVLAETRRWLWELG